MADCGCQGLPGELKGDRWFMRHSRWLFLGGVFLVLLIAASASAEVCPGAKVPKAERTQCDFQATLSPTDTELALRTQLPWGEPVCPQAAGQKISADASDAFLASHTLSIHEIESLTSLDLFPRLDGEALVETVASELWPRN